MTVAKCFWHCLKPRPWPYFNSGQSRLHIRGPIVDPYSIINYYWPNISGKCVLSTSKCSVHQHFPLHSNYRLDGALCCLILMWGSRSTKPYLLLLLQKLLHKIWGIENPIISVLSLDHHSLNLSLPLKGEFCRDSFSSVYGQLVLKYHINTGMVNKNTSSWEHIRWIWFPSLW